MKLLYNYTNTNVHLFTSFDEYLLCQTIEFISKQHGIIAKLAACISLQKHRHDINQINYRRIVSRITSSVLLVFTPLLLQSPK